MKNFTRHEIGFSLDHWIDTKTGMFRATGPEHKYAVKELAKRLQDCVRHVFYWSDKSLWDEHCFDYEVPPIDVSGVDIKFSDEVVVEEKEVRSGIGNTDLGINRCIDRYLDSGEPVEILSRDEPITIKQRTLGKFRAASGNADKIGTITLYNKAIAEFCGEEGIDYTIVFWGTLAHESFHAFHYNLFRNHGKTYRWNHGSIEKYRGIVKESLAAAFEFIFLIKHQGDCLDNAGMRMMKDHLENTWRKYDVEDWPYSGALSICGAELAKIATIPDLMNMLCQISVYDWKTAADIIKTGYYLSDPEVQKAFGVVSK